MAEAMPLPHFIATSIVVAFDLALNFLNYFDLLNAGIWRFWEDFITVAGLSVLPQVMWSTFVPYIPNSILPGITAFFLAVAAVVMHVTEQSENNDSGPFIMNAFEMITLFQGLNLSALFDRRQTRLEGMSVNKIGQFAVVLEVFEVAPFLFMVDVRKATGDTNEYHKFYKNFCAKLEHIIWKPKDGPAKSSA